MAQNEWLRAVKQLIAQVKATPPTGVVDTQIEWLARLPLKERHEMKRKLQNRLAGLRLPTLTRARDPLLTHYHKDLMTQTIKMLERLERLPDMVPPERRPKR